MTLRQGPAAIDRLVHHSTIIEFAVPSFRSDQARKKPEKNAGQAKTSSDNYPRNTTGKNS